MFKWLFSMNIGMMMNWLQIIVCTFIYDYKSTIVRFYRQASANTGLLRANIREGN